MDMIICIICILVTIGYPALVLHMIAKKGGSPASESCGEFIEMLLHDR